MIFISFNENTPKTRTALLELRNKRKIASFGLEILKDKEDALLSEFLEVIKQAKNARTHLSNNLSLGNDALLRAENWLGPNNTESIATSTTPQKNIFVDEKNIMGTTVPKISAKNLKRDLFSRGYNLHDTTESIDIAADFFETSLDCALRVGEEETSAQILAEQITNTRTKTNALEKIIIPEIFNNEKKIRANLNETERQETAKIKRIKRILKKN